MVFKLYKLSNEIESVIPNIYFFNPSDQPVGTEPTIYHNYALCLLEKPFLIFVVFIDLQVSSMIKKMVFNNVI